MTTRDRSPSVAEALRGAALRLADTDAPRLTAEVFLAHALGLTRSQLLARPELPVSPEAQARFAEWVGRASDGEPLAYLVGRREFHGLDFLVDARVLVPRPETELLVDLALQYLSHARGASVVDVGTGSGCIAVTLAAKHPPARVTAVDISPAALAVARANAERHAVQDRLTVLQSDLLSAFAFNPSPFDLVCANLPYIASDELGALPVARHEPRLALEGGRDGLQVIRRLLGQAPGRMRSTGCLLLEVGAGQGRAVAALARAAFPAAAVLVHPDLAGHDRIVSVSLGARRAG